MGLVFGDVRKHSKVIECVLSKQHCGLRAGADGREFGVKNVPM